MTRTPALAERLVASSLAACDRDAVLGDLQEEFEAIAAERNTAAARRWYWAQTLRSVGPNLFRRVRQERFERRVEESAWQRASRRSIRTIGLATIALPVVFGMLAWFNGEVSDVDGLVIAFTLPFGVIGAAMFLGSFSPSKRRDARTMALNLRRWSLAWGVYAFSRCVLLSLSRRSAFARAINELGTALSLIVILWPARYWPLQTPAFGPAIPRVRTPFLGARVQHDGSASLSVEAPDYPRRIGDLILARAGESRVAFDRRFTRADAVRVWTAIRRGESPLRVTVEIADPHGRVVDARSAPLAPASFVVDQTAPASPPPGPVSQVDVAMPLAALQPGAYRIRLRASDGLDDEVEEAAFDVA